MLQINHQRSLQAFICSRILGQDALADKLLTHPSKSVVVQFLSVPVHVAAVGDRAGVAERREGWGEEFFQYYCKSCFCCYSTSIGFF